MIPGTPTFRLSRLDAGIQNKNKLKKQVKNIRNVIIAMRTIAVVVNVLQTQSALVYPTLLLGQLFAVKISFVVLLLVSVGLKSQPSP